MTPQEKAEELVNKINDQIRSYEDIRLRGKGYEMSKQLALICVYELIKESCKDSEYKDPYHQENRIGYWQQVKQEIEKL